MVYRDNRIDLGVCKTNVAICHKVKKEIKDFFFDSMFDIKPWTRLESTLLSEGGGGLAS